MEQHCIGDPVGLLEQPPHSIKVVDHALSAGGSDHVGDLVTPVAVYEPVALAQGTTAYGQLCLVDALVLL